MSWTSGLLQARLGARFIVLDHGGCIEITEPGGRHLCALYPDDDGAGLQVEVTVSMVLVDDGRAPDERAETADALFRDEHAAYWSDHGFEAAEVGECHGVDAEGEDDALDVDDDPDAAVIWSYELPLRRPLSPDDDVDALMRWLRDAPLDLVLWSEDGPLSAADPQAT